MKKTEKRLIAVILAFVCFCPAKAQYDFDTVEKIAMAKAKVKTQTEWTYEFVGGKPSDKGYKSGVKKYNVHGSVVEKISYNAEGAVMSMWIYQYDSSDRPISEERYQGNREKLQYSQKITYDAKGNKISELGFDGVSAYNNTFTYDASKSKLTAIKYILGNTVVERRTLGYEGDKTIIQVFDASNKLTFQQENTHNAKNLLVSEIRKNSTNAIVYTLDMRYNSSGMLLEETKKRAGEKMEYQTLYSYDNVNRPVKEESVGLDGIKYVSHEYGYNNAGQLTEEIWKKNSKAKEPSTKKITYNAKGIYSEVEVYFASYKLYSLYKYMYEFY